MSHANAASGSPTPVGAPGWFERRLGSRGRDRLGIAISVERERWERLKGNIERGGIPYVVIGLVWASFHAEQVQQIETLLQTRLPAGSEIAAFGQVAVMWPVLLLAPNVCML